MSEQKEIRVYVPANLEPSEFYDEYFAWLMEREVGTKDYYIGLYEAGHRFSEFIEEKHPERMVQEEPNAPA